MGVFGLKIVCLIENTAVNDKLFSEEGLSLFVEYNGKNYKSKRINRTSH